MSTSSSPPGDRAASARTTAANAGSSVPELHVVGVQAAWEEVYRAQVVPLYRFVFARVGNRPDAEDVTAQTFLRALPRLRRGASEAEVRGYLYTTARTVLADHWTARFGAETALPDVSHLSAPVATPPAADAAERAAALLERLPDRYRRILELRFLRGCSVREAAAEMEVSVGNAKVMQWRALRRAAALDGGQQP